MCVPGHAKADCTVAVHGYQERGGFSRLRRVKPGVTSCESMKEERDLCIISELILAHRQ